MQHMVNVRLSAIDFGMLTLQPSGIDFGMGTESLPSFDCPCSSGIDFLMSSLRSEDVGFGALPFFLRDLFFFRFFDRFNALSSPTFALPFFFEVGTGTKWTFNVFGRLELGTGRTVLTTAA